MNGLARQVYENAGILFRRFLLSSHSVTRAPPHIRDANNVQRLWNYFVIASIPAWLIGLWSLGHQTNLAIAEFALDPAPGWRAALLVKTGIGLGGFVEVIGEVKKGDRIVTRGGERLQPGQVVSIADS